jgi:rhamnosyltransferase
MKYRTTVVLVTYNPDLELLKQIVDNLLSQRCTICIVNNSATQLQEFYPEIKIINFYENKGIAFAQTTGMTWAFNENGSDFVLQMDQDSLPADNLLDSLISAWERLKELGLRVGLIGSQDIDRDTLVYSEAKFNKGKKISGTDLEQVSEVLSSGSLIPRSTFEQLGGPDAKLFIDLVDFEYCWRIAAKDLLIVKNPASHIYHKLGDGQVRILGMLSVGLPKPFRHYYSVRNTVYLILFGKAPIYWKASNSFKVLFKLVVYPITLPQGKERFNYIWKGFKDGIFKRFQIINA